MCFAREFPMKLNAKGLIWRGDTLIFNAVALLAKLCLEYGVNTTAGSYTSILILKVVLIIYLCHISNLNTLHLLNSC